MTLPRILVVDDEEVMRDVLGNVLGGHFGEGRHRHRTGEFPGRVAAHAVGDDEQMTVREPAVLVAGPT